jgi:hypothetical protein
MNRIWRPVTYFLAVVYFLVDLIFVGLARPISEWVARHVVSRRLRTWIRSLPPYPSLALFSVPVILLETHKTHRGILGCDRAVHERYSDVR